MREEKVFTVMTCDCCGAQKRYPDGTDLSRWVRFTADNLYAKMLDVCPSCVQTIAHKAADNA